MMKIHNKPPFGHLVWSHPAGCTCSWREVAQVSQSMGDSKASRTPKILIKYSDKNVFLYIASCKSMSSVLVHFPIMVPI